MSSLYAFVKFSSSYRKLKRFRTIASILALHGFGDIATRIGLRSAWRRFKRIVTFGKVESPQYTMTTGERLRIVCEELGPTYIKFGQMLSNRPDLFPPDIIKELSRLQDQVPPFPYDRVKEVLEEQLLLPAREIFEEIEETPLAAASIAQVHRAKLKSGETVAIKVKRPGVGRTVNQDLDVLKAVAAYLEDSVPDLAYVRPVHMVEEFARIIKQEMDFANEVRNMERFADNMADEPVFRIPRPFKEYCTEDLIIMEFMDGVKVTDVERWQETCPLAPAEIAEIGTRALLKSVFEHRFYHCDPHPGNFLIGKDGRICLLDFGMMGFVGETRMEEMLSFMVALVSYDPEMLVDSILQAGLAPEDLDVKELRRDVEFMMNQYSALSLDELQLEPLIRQASATIFRHRILLPTDLLGVARAISTMEGIGRQIYPEFKPLEAVQPYLITLFLRRALDPTYQSGHLVDMIMNWAALLKQLPEDVRDIMRRLKKGELTIKYENRNARVEMEEATRRTNRLAGVLLSAVGVAASFFLLQVEDIPDFIPALAFSGSFLVAIWVALGIRRSGGM